MLKLTKFIGKGATRICFEHPKFPDKCVKIVVRFKDFKLLERELAAYHAVQNDLREYIIEYDNHLVETNLGYGLVCKTLRDDGGEYSKSLNYYLNNHCLTVDLRRQLYNFIYNLVEHDLFFYDFNLQNFVVQIQDGKHRLYYTDLKSFNNYKSWTFLKFEKIFTPLARYLMCRRIKRLLQIVEQI